MGMLELVMIALVGLMVHLLIKKVGFNYVIVGQALDVLGLPGVQDRLFTNPKHVELIQRVVDRYFFLTKTFPVMVLGIVGICVSLYLSLRGSVISGNGTAVEWVFLCSAIIAGAITWLVTFDPTPDWLYESHVHILLAKSSIELELIQKALQDIEDKASDELSEEEAGLIQIQCLLLSEMAKDVEANVKDLQQQKQALHS